MSLLLFTRCYLLICLLIFYLHDRLKLKRPQAARAFRSEIDVLYEELKAAESSKPKL